MFWIYLGVEYLPISFWMQSEPSLCTRARLNTGLFGGNGEVFGSGYLIVFETFRNALFVDRSLAEPELFWLSIYFILSHCSTSRDDRAAS